MPPSNTVQENLIHEDNHSLPYAGNLVLHKYDVLFKSSSEAFHSVTELVSQVFKVPIAFVSLHEEDRIYLKSWLKSLDMLTTSKEDSLYSFVTEKKEHFIVEDIAAHPQQLQSNSFFTQQNIRFFAGVPLMTEEGYAIGTLSIADYSVRSLSGDEIKLLQQFARMVMQEAEMRIITSQQTIIKESHQKMLALVNNSIELMSILELDGKNSYLNRAGIEMLGFDNLEQVLVTPIAALHEPEDIAFVQANVLPSVMSSGRWSGRMNVRHLKTGEVFPVFNNTVRIDDPITKEPIAIGAVMRDMRPELAAQQELIISEDEMRNALEAAEMGYWNVDPETMTLRCNERTKMLFGLPEDEAVDLKLALDAIHEKDRNRVVKEIERVLQYESGGDYDIEYRVISHRDKKQRVIRAKGKTYFNDNKEPYQFSGTVQDITIQKQQEQKLHTVLESLPQMAWTANVLGEVDYFNKGWYDYSGDEKGDTLGNAWSNTLHPDDRQVVIEEWQSSVSTGKEYVREVRFKRRDGAFRWHLVRGVPIRNDNDDIVFWTGTCTDIHDQKAAAEVLEQKIKERTIELQVANEQLEQSNHELEQFAHVSSHDLQEPLRKIIFFTEMVRETNATQLDATASNHMLKVSEAAKRMSTSLKALLNYTRLQKEETWEEVDLNMILHEVMDDLELLIDQKKARVGVEKMPIIRGQKHQVKQLFYNLVNNALKFSKEDTTPTVAISTRELNGSEIPRSLSAGKRYLEITVKDNGIGFDDNLSEKVFTLFQRLHDRTKYPGTGIGLALCKKVAQKHGGTIWVKSKPDEGSSFHVVLPMI